MKVKRKVMIKVDVYRNKTTGEYITRERKHLYKQEVKQEEIDGFEFLGSLNGGTIIKEIEFKPVENAL